MKAITSKLVVLTLFVTSIACSEASRNIYKLHEEGKIGKHTHISIVGGKKILVEIGKHMMKGTSSHIWYKLIKEKGRPTLRYTKQHPSEKWQLLPKGCSAHEPVKPRNVDKCADGWEIGKVIARTITYLALHRGHMEMGNSGKTQHNSTPRTMASTATQVDMDEVAENIRKVVSKTAQCIKKGLSLSGFTMKQMCIHRSMMKEANKLINKIIENAAEHGFKCDYEALKEGKCKLIGSASQLEAGISLLKKLKSF